MPLVPLASSLSLGEGQKRLPELSFDLPEAATKESPSERRSELRREVRFEIHQEFHFEQADIKDEGDLVKRFYDAQPGLIDAILARLEEERRRGMFDV